MRVWHKFLIPVLPRQQLVSQYREDCAIMKAIAENGTPNHILVNKINDYPIVHFAAYHCLIMDEMAHRGYKTRADAIAKFYDNYFKITERDWAKDGRDFLASETINGVFSEDKDGKIWHGQRYLIQCLYNLQEKYDCGGLTEEEYAKIDEVGKEWSISL